MSKQLKNRQTRQTAKHWGRQAASALAAIPLLLQPTGQAGAASGVNGAVSRIVITTQDTVTYDLSTLFPDRANFQVVTDNPNVAVGMIYTSSSVMAITPHGPGAATFTVTTSGGEPLALKVLVLDPGTDGKIDIEDIGKWAHAYPAAIQSTGDMMSLLQSISSRSVNGRPVAKGTSLSPVTLTAGQSDFIPAWLGDYFTDPEGDELAITARSSNPAIVTASYTDGGISLEGIGQGSATVTLQAMDAAGGTAEITMQVTVERGNSMPEQVPSVTLYWLDGHEEMRIPMESLFHDPDGDTLEYSYTRTVVGGEAPLALSQIADESSLKKMNLTSQSVGEADYGASVQRDKNTLVIFGSGGGSDFYTTLLEISATDAHFPDNPVKQWIQILPAGAKGDLLASRKIFKDARMEIDLHQIFNYTSVTGSTYHYYLADEGRTVTAGTYSNAFIQGNKLIIDGTASSEYGEGGLFNSDHYKIFALYDDHGQKSEVIDAFDLSVEELPWQGSGLELQDHLPWPEEIRGYSKSGQWFEDSGNAASGSYLDIHWGYATEGTLTVNANFDWEAPEGNPSPVVTYKIRFIPHLPPL